MAEDQPPASLPSRPKELAEEAAAPSKNALKKAAKDKEKAEKAAKRKAAEDAQRKESEASDISSDDYGHVPLVGLPSSTPAEVPWVRLSEIASEFTDTTPMDESGGPHVIFQAVAENARVQSAKLAFLVFRQGQDTIQAVVAASDTLSRQMVKFAGSMSAESVVLVHGIVKKPKELVKSTSISHLEVHVKKLYIISEAEVLPMQLADAERALPVEGEEAQEDDSRPIVTLSTRLNNRTIDLAAKQNRAIFTIKDGVVALFSEYLRNLGFIGIQSPKLLGASSEGGSNVFEVKYFERKAYLAQSPQLYKQMLIAAGWDRVFEVNPVFRAENSNTARHLTEFTGLDLEMAFDRNYHEVVELLEGLMLYIFNGLRTKYKDATETVRKIYHVEEFKLPEAGKVPRISFAEGIQMLREDGLEIGDFEDLSTPDEKRLGALVLKKYNSDFYVLDQFPLAIRPFYTMPSASHPYFSSKETGSSAPATVPDPNTGYSNSYDFFMRGQEILSGAQRIHSAAFLQQRMREAVTPVDPNSDGLRDYVNAFKYGCPRHGGGGIGLERIVMLWLGLPNIRLASAFPRDPGRLLP
ncbi:hypothetical protein LTR66_005180 [Elasticomyces elasticus]|nr:hypothetical protein LTR66_005180 [Elasticomyces elasticus]